MNVRLNWRYDNYCLYPYNTKSQRNIFVIANPRNTILSVLIDEKKVKSEQKIEGTKFFWGWDINFNYEEKTFQWNTDGNVYLIDEDGKQKVNNTLPLEEITDSSMLEDNLKMMINIVPTNI